MARIKPLLLYMVLLGSVGLHQDGFSQCDARSEGVLTYCNSFDNGSIVDGYFVGFRVISFDGAVLDVVDRGGNNVTNRGKRIDDINNDDEPANVTIAQLSIGGGADSIEYWYFGPYDNGDPFDIVLVDPDGICDTVEVASGTFSCVGASPTGACDTTDVPLWFLDFSMTEFDIGGGDGGNENIDEVFLVMSRSRVATCCDISPSSSRCFEFLVRLAPDDIGITIDDVGSGSTGGSLYADSLNNFMCTGTTNDTWPFQQDNGQSADIEPLCLIAGVSEYIVLSCKPGANVTSATIDAVAAPLAPPDATVEPCNASLEVFDADSASWSSDDDPTLANFLMCNGDSTLCSFLYDTMMFGEVMNCAGDTFVYVVGATPDETACFGGDTVLFDTTYVVVYPTFSVVIDSTCNETGDSLELEAVVSSPADGCDYAYAWSTGENTPTIVVEADGSLISVTITRASLPPDVQECVVIADTIQALLDVTLDCSAIMDATYQCVEDVPPADLALIVVSGCAIPLDTFVVESNNMGAGCIGDTLVITRHYITDQDGNLATTADQDTCTQIITVVDDTPPMIICPGDISVECNESADPADTGTATATDNCDPAPAVSFSDNITPGQCAQQFTIVRTWTATDDCGNTVTCVQNIFVDDNTAPEISCPADVTLECNESTDPANTGTATATDNCDLGVSVTFSDTVTPGNCAAGGIMRLWTATDACGNTATCVQAISIDDETPPEITCPADATIACDESTSPDNTGTATAVDNCDDNVAVTFSDQTSPGVCAQEMTITRTWTATDICGNTATCVQVINVEDATAPEITCPGDVTVECDESTAPANTGTATATDNCDPAPVVTFSDQTSPGACAQEMTITRTWMATDACGNTTTCVQTISVADDTAPEITCPGDITVECDDSTDPAGTGTATATDNCDPMPTVTFSDQASPGVCAQEMTITRTWTATDVCGNTATCQQTITVQDNSPPAITCPADTTIDCDTSTDPAATGMPTVVDNCDGAPATTFSDVVTPGACGEERMITRTWTTTDACGNANSCIQTISVQDTTPPTAICQDITVDFEGMDTVDISVELIDNGSFDNCGDVILEIDQDTFVCTEVENNMAQVTLTVTDECGLQSTCTANVMFVNASLLMLECPDTVFIDPPDGICEVVVDYDVIASDACGNTFILEQIDTSGFALGDLAPIDTTFIQTWRVYNMQGDTLMCTFPVIISGVVGEGVMACKHALNLSLDQNCKATITPQMLLTISPGCDADLVVSPKDTSFELIDGNMVDDSFVGMTIPVMVTDLTTGNACWTFVTVEDKLPPAIVCGSDTVFCYESVHPLDIGLPVEGEEEIIQNPDGSFTVLGIGQCGPVLFEYFDETILKNCASPFTRMIKRHWTATDVNGNSSTCVDSIYVERIGIGGITLPEHFDNIDNPGLECNSNCILPDGTPDVACTGAPGGETCENIWIRFTDQIIPKCGGAYKVLRQWRILDLCTGDEIIFVQKILVDDTTPPVVQCQDTVTVTSGSASCTGLVQLPLPDITDACSDYTIDVFAPDGTLHENNGQYWVSDLSAGCHTITFVVTDACFNVATCEQIVCVEDQTEPVAICDQHSVMTLSEPVTLISAESLSDHSYDACGEVTFAGRRMDSCIDIDWTTNGSDSDETPNGIVNGFDQGIVFQSEIPFACCDVGTTVMVEILVTDESGNANSCMVEVTVQDKSQPTITCPPDFTVNCDFFFDTEALDDIGDRTYGTVLNGLIYTEMDRLPVIVDGTEWGKDGIAFDLCGLELSLSVIDNRNMCGLGTIDRIFTATDGINSVSCTQEITVVNETPFNEADHIIWPGDLTLEGGCDVDISETGEPIILDAPCELVGVAYEDLVIPFDPNACAKVIRTWRVIDWCTYESGVSGLWTHQQVIKVVNSVGPEPVMPVEDLELCQDDPQVTVDDPNSCMANVAFSLEVMDDCTPAENLRWSYVVDLLNDGDFEIVSPLFDAGEGGSVVQGNTLVLNIDVEDMPMNDGADLDEMHQIQWVVADRCGNESRINQLVRLNDCKDPIVICQDLIASINNEIDEVTIWASDFNASSADNCTDTPDLIYSFSGTEIIPSMTFDCDDAIANGSEDFEIDVWVIDEYGNSAFCTVTFTLDGAQDECGLMLTTISGSLKSQMGQHVRNAAVDLMEQSAMYANTMSDVDGAFGFSALPMHGDYMVKPFKNDDTKKGVSTLDLITIQKHLLGIQEFDSPYKYIAADINNSQSVSALDLIQLRKIILGVFEEFPDNTSWRFMPEGFTFIDPASPWPFEESILYDDVTQSMTEADFVGIKVGDVNGSFVAGAQVVATRSPEDAVFLRLKDRDVHAGEIVRIPVEIDAHGAALAGIQFALSASNALWLGIEGNPNLSIGAENYHADESRLSVSWHATQPVDSDAGVILIFEVLEDGRLSDVLHLDRRAMTPEAYTDKGQDVLDVRPLEVVFGAGEQPEHDFALFQNTPNPWTHETTIGFELPQDLPVILHIYDATGRILREFRRDGQAGYNEITLDGKVFDTATVMYYRLTAGAYSATKKMVLWK